jgi:hypothetical protein
MKFRLIYIFCIMLTGLSSCSDKLEVPATDYVLQNFDKVKGEWVDLPTPYTATVDEKLRVVSYNNSEYNAFYQGDSIVENKVMIKRIYVSEPDVTHRGVALVYKNDLKMSVAEIKYPSPGVFRMTLVANAVGNDGNDVVFAINDKHSIEIKK